MDCTYKGRPQDSSIKGRLQRETNIMKYYNVLPPLINDIGSKAFKKLKDARARRDFLNASITGMQYRKFNGTPLYYIVKYTQEIIK